MSSESSLAWLLSDCQASLGYISLFSHYSDTKAT